MASDTDKVAGRLSGTSATMTPSANTKLSLATSVTWAVICTGALSPVRVTSSTVSSSARAPSRRTLAVCGTSARSASDVFSAEYSWKIRSRREKTPGTSVDISRYR
jgi:hypothetical protein